jgi:predicted transcriptional regulator
MPELVQLRSQNKDRIEVIGLHAGKGDQLSVGKIVQDQKLPYPVVMIESKDEVKAWGVERLPDVVLVDRTGRVRYAHLGAKEGFEKAQMLLAE